MDSKPANVYTVPQFVSDVRLLLRMAAIYSFLALIGVSVVGLLVATGRPNPGFPVVRLLDVVATIGVFVLIYVVAALGSAGAVFLLRPLRSSWIGWALTGGFAAGICYGALFAFLLHFSSVTSWFLSLRGGSVPGPGDLEFFLVLVGTIMVPVGAVVGVYWRDNPP